MATATPITTRGVLITEQDDRLALVRAVARWMDTAVEIPGTNIKFGLDSVLGLLPGIGDAIASAIGGYIILAASRMGVSRVVILRMLMNLGIDTVVGSVPLVGDVLDVAWKANVKNVALLEEALADPHKSRRSGVWALLGVAAIVVLIGAAGAALTWFLLAHVSWKA